MRQLILAFSLALCACAASPPPEPEGDGSFGAACAMPPSDMAPDCDSHICTGTIDRAGHPVCSQLCTKLGLLDDSCPPGADGRRFCNMKGYCKP
jgi:hypothetical protein